MGPVGSSRAHDDIVAVDVVELVVLAQLAG